VIIGGMGSFWGTLAGGLLLGVTKQIGFRVDLGWDIWFGHLVFLAVLVLNLRVLTSVALNARDGGSRYCGLGPAVATRPCGGPVEWLLLTVPNSRNRPIPEFHWHSLPAAKRTVS